MDCLPGLARSRNFSRSYPGPRAIAGVEGVGPRENLVFAQRWLAPMLVGNASLFGQQFGERRATQAPTALTKCLRNAVPRLAARVWNGTGCIGWPSTCLSMMLVGP